MTVSGLVPGRDLYVVMRTVTSQRAVSLHANGAGADDYVFASPIKLMVLADGREACYASLSLPEEGFGDVSFVVPGEGVDSDSVRLAFIGAHTAFGYWFYQ